LLEFSGDNARDLMKISRLKLVNIMQYEEIVLEAKINPFTLLEKQRKQSSYPMMKKREMEATTILNAIPSTSTYFQNSTLLPNNILLYLLLRNIIQKKLFIKKKPFTLLEEKRRKQSSYPRMKKREMEASKIINAIPSSTYDDIGSLQNLQEKLRAQINRKRNRKRQEPQNNNIRGQVVAPYSDEMASYLKNFYHGLFINQGTL
jgi:hypothetical protein